MPTKRAEHGASHTERIEAVLRDRWLYSARTDDRDPTLGGRPRMYPDFMEDLYASLVDIYTSARAASTALHASDRVIWDFIRRVVAEENPNNPELHLPATPPCRTWFVQRRKRAAERGLEHAQEEHLDHTVELAGELGYFDPKGPGSYTHPDRSRMLYGDGKVIKPLFNGTADDTREVRSFDPNTGEEIIERVPVRFDPDAKTHTQGDGRVVEGNKFAVLAGRGPEPHDRLIFGVGYVADVKGEHNSEADILMDLIERTTRRLPGALGVLTDTVLRGVHHEQLQRELGLLTMNPVTAKKVDAKTGDRTEKEYYLGTQIFPYADETTEEIEIWTRAGHICRVIYDDRGRRVLDPLHRKRTFRNRNEDGTWRFYVEYAVPDPRGGAPRIWREPTTGDDLAGGHSRAENIRQVPPDDPDYKVVAGRRSDAESINRHRDDNLYLRRAHSVGAQRQLYDYLAYARTVNALALYRHRQRQAAALAEAA
jgi:hypothetical protein